jgi:hypothetical protein
LSVLLFILATPTTVAYKVAEDVPNQGVNSPVAHEKVDTGSMYHLNDLKAKYGQGNKLTHPNIIDLADAIKDFEGYYAGSVSERNNNPGNLRYSPFQTGKRDGFSYFETYERGYYALIYQIELAVTDRSAVYHSDMTIQEFFNVYAPASDDNQPSIYADTVAQQIGVSVNTKLSELYTD